MIKNIKGKTTSDIFDGLNTKHSRKIAVDLQERARDLLDVINAISRIDDLKTPPSNRLHKLKGHLSEYWSVSINSQWRIIFKWDGQYAIDVEIVDYH